MTKKIVTHTFKSDALGDNGITFAGISSFKEYVWITYYSSLSESDYNSGIRLKKRETPLTKEQWDARVKQIQNGKN